MPRLVLDFFRGGVSIDVLSQNSLPLLASSVYFLFA